MKKYMTVLLVTGLSGCASIDFNADEDGAVYYEPVPYLFYSVTDKCVSSATAVTLPGEKKASRLQSRVWVFQPLC